jgi:non-specific riboncleoside hydrolase
MHQVIIDTDPGIDDAVALAVALFHEEIDVKLITCVSGNVSLEKTTLNTLRLLEYFCKTDIPVAAGASEPLVKEPEYADDIHGNSGLDGFKFPEISMKTIPYHGVNAMKEILNNATSPITLVPIGPLTNIALLFTMYPECKSKIDRIILMGGSANRGNTTPYAEFNIYVDPEAADKVFRSNVPIVMCGCDIGDKAVITFEMFQQMKQMNKISKMLCNLFESYRGGSLTEGLKMYDLCAIAYLLVPEMFKTTESFVGVELNGTYTKGSTNVDLLHRLGKAPNAKVLTDIDVVKFQTWFMQQMEKINL